MRPSKRDIDLPVAVLMACLVALAACSTQDLATTLAAAKDKANVSANPSPQGTIKPSGTGLTGSVPDDSSGQTPTPAPSGSAGTNASGTTAPTATPIASPTATSQPYQAFSVEVTVTPSTASINLRDPENIGGANYPSSVVLSADVLLSNNSHATSVTWTSSNTQIAAVSPAGVVTVGTNKGTATITATATDGQSLGTCTVTVKDDSALDVTID